VVAARGPLPGTADEVTAVDDGAGSHRRVGRRDADRRIVAPDLFLRLLVEQREVPVVHADDRADPARRAACAAEPTHGLVERGGVALEAAPLFGLQQLEETGLVEFGDGLVRDAPEILGGLRALGDQRQQVVDAV
jgi:hypothetical protein